VSMTAVIFLLCAAPWAARKPAGAAADEKETPLYLVARPGMRDPYFRQSVVLMLPATGTPLVVGIIINKPTPVPLVRLFPQIPSLKTKNQRAYFGGPVGVHESIALFSSPRVPKLAIRLFGSVCMSLDSNMMERLLKDSRSGQQLRLFLGRAQWSQEQLQGELQSGAWVALHANSNLIFSRNPESLWRTLLKRARPGSLVEYTVPFGFTPQEPPGGLLRRPMKQRLL